MDLFTLYDWITSLLRPRVTYKTTTTATTQKQQQNNNLLTTTTGANKQQTPNSEAEEIEEHLVYAEPAINTIELIPTLQFVTATTPINRTHEVWQQCLETCLNVGDTNTEIQPHVAATNSQLTFTVERTPDGEGEQRQQQHHTTTASSSLDTSELLQQEVVTQLLSLTDTASLTTFFDEPTSSISIDIMESSQKTTATTSEQRSTTTTSDHMPQSVTTTPITTTTTTTTSSQSNVPQSFTNLSLSDQDEVEEDIEEEIEEALEMSEELPDSLPGPSKKPAAAAATKKPLTEQLFGIEFSESSSEVSPGPGHLKSSKSLKSTSDDDQFKIDDDQLSGGKLAQHFVLEDEESGDLDDVSLPMEKRFVHSKHESSEFEAEVNLDQQEESLTNQSTADDVSELQEEADNDTEESTHDKDSKTLEESEQDLKDSEAKESLETSVQSKVAVNPHDISAAEVSHQKVNSPPHSKSHKLEPRNVHKLSLPELFENPDIKPLSGASSEHSEKDHSIEEILASNHSLEMTLDDHNLSSLNPSFVKNNETLINELLKDTPDKARTDPIVKSSEKLSENTRNLYETQEPLKEIVKPPTGSKGDLYNTSSNQENIVLHKTEKEISENVDNLLNPIKNLNLPAVESCGDFLESSGDFKKVSLKLQNVTTSREYPIIDVLQKEITQLSPTQKLESMGDLTKSNEQMHVPSTNLREIDFQQENIKKLEFLPREVSGRNPELHQEKSEISNTQKVENSADLGKSDDKEISGDFDFSETKENRRNPELQQEKTEISDNQKVESSGDLGKSDDNLLQKENLKKLESSQQENIGDFINNSTKSTENDQSKISSHENNKRSEFQLAKTSGDFLKNSPNLEKTSENLRKSEISEPDYSEDFLEQTLRSEMITDLDDSLQEAEEKPTTSTKFKEDLQKEDLLDNKSSLLSEENWNSQRITWESLQIDTENVGGCREEDDEETSLQLMKFRIMAMKLQPKDIPAAPLSPTEESVNSLDSSSQVKAMERVSLVEFTKEVLEDITEESERNSLSTQDEQNSLTQEKSNANTLTSKSDNKTLHNEPDNSNSIVSLDMIQMLEQKVGELQQMLAGKDACLASLNLQLENSHRRDSNAHNSAEQLGSGRDSSSLVTNSTEYRTFQEDFGQPTMDIYMELSKRDELIAKLTDSLQQSLNVRENLQTESEKLSQEVLLLRKQLSEAMDSLKKPFWPRDQESNCGQRISEISMDLISESDDELDRLCLTDNEEKFSRNSRERQLSMPRQYDYAISDVDAGSDSTPFSKQIEQFQKYLTPSEVRLFFMVQKKFDDYLCQELEKCKMKYDQELKIFMDQWDTEKREKDIEIQRLMQLRQERDVKHNQEMEDLRKYFETKCADLEKQYSDDVFSQKSQRQGMTSSSASECSDQEHLPDDFKITLQSKSKETSPRKRSKTELLLSPSHRQMTPGNEIFNDESDNNQGTQLALEITELKTFYQNKIHEIQRFQDDNIKKLTDRLKYYESRYPEDEFMSSTKNSTMNLTSESNTTTATTNTEDLTQITVRSLNQSQNQSAPKKDDSGGGGLDVEAAGPATASVGSPVTSNFNNNNMSLIIIDQDELNCNNEAQVIQKIIDEYERRLQEQLALAREDIVHELEQQIQTLLSETTTDDQHWPKELILLREKFTAKSQLEIAQLQIKHADEMSRLKQDYEKQLNRKNKRHSTFDSVRDFDKLLSERDNLRDLSRAFRQVLSELLKCVANCENDLTDTLAEEVQRLLSCNRTFEEHGLEDTLNSTLLNETLNSTKLRMIPDVQSLLEVVEDPNLVQFVNDKNFDSTEDFDLKDCLERLRSEASYLLHLSEEVVKKHDSKERRESFSSEAEKHDSEQEDELKLQQHRKFIRVNSLNEQQLPTHQSLLIHHTQPLSSLPPDLNKLYLDNNSSIGVNAAELNFQLVELKNRLVKSENDRVKLQHELEHTISRNSELGQELQHLRDQLSQLSSLNNVEYNEGYGMGSMKSPRLSNSDNSSSFALLQEKARNILSTPTQKQPNNNDSTIQLLQMIEDFCREGDKVVEGSKKDREDLQSQIITADKQLKATRQFLEEQAAEREQERDEFLKEIESLKSQLRDKEKERSSYANASEEVLHLESQIRDLTQKLQESNSKRDKFEVELKASIDKIFVLREIISDLETQVETKALNEHVMGEKVKQLEEYIDSQSRSNEALHSEVQSLKTEIEHSYQARINQLEEKLQNIRPSAEQSLIMDQVVEQLRDIENTLEQKTKNLESLHSNSNSCSLSMTEDVSVHGSKPSSLLAAIVTPPQGSPVHPSPRQHSLTMEGVQRVVDKLSKHSRVEEAAVKRIRDLEMQVQQMRTACVELQHERESLQERMSEQTQRISALQSRLEEQRQRAEELQRSNTSDLNIRLHDLQNELQNLRETLSNRDKQIATLKQQLEKSKIAIDRLEAELAVEQQPDRSALERLETDLKQKQAENQKLKDKIKNEMINKLALPDLMETMLADKNEEIDHLKEQLENKEKELQTVLDMSQNSSMEGATKKPEETSTKLSARTLSDIVSITEFDEPDLVRRAAAANNMSSPLMLPEGSGGFLHQTMETSKGAIANLTHKRTEDLSGFATLQQVNTFDHPHYFQDPHVLLGSAQSAASITPALVPRQINFSAMTEDSKLKTPFNSQTNDAKPREDDKAAIENYETQIRELKEKILSLERDKEKNADYLISSQLRLTNLQDELAHTQKELLSLQQEAKKNKELQQELLQKSQEIEELLREQNKLRTEKSELLTKNEKNLKNYQESEELYQNRLKDMEEKLLKNTENEMKERENLRKELRAISEVHEQCKYTQKDNENRKKELDRLNQEIKIKDERLLTITTKLSIAEDTIGELHSKITQLEKEIEKLKQQNSDNSSKQFSVDEIAQQVEKELNYSAQLDSNILKAIESEEENNLDRSHQEKIVATEQPGTTDDENFTGERELLNQLEALRAQITVEREHTEELRQELMQEKHHSQEVQEQDVIIIEAMRKRFESAVEQEEELHKQLDIERERYERLQTQLTTLQRTDSRRNSALLKSPIESPRKSPRSLSDFESELAERLRSEIKLLTAQNERERERSADLQRNTERERLRYEKELLERIEYCEKLKREMEKVARDKDNAEMEIEHLQERLTLQTQEIESLEARIASLQEAETRRHTRKEKQHKEYASLMAEIQELKTQLYSLESEKEGLNKTISQLRFDVERSAQREVKLAEALSNANANLASRDGQSSVPEQFLQKMKEINTLLAENTQENKQMAETVQYLVDERLQLQQKCEDLETKLSGSANVSDLEERCNHLLGRYLRVESHRKALVYQKRYLKISLQNYQDSEQRALAAFNGGQLLQTQRPKKKLFKTVALAIIAIQRMKYIGRIWHTGKRIVSKSVFTITQQKRSQPPTLSCVAITSTTPTHVTAPNGQPKSPYFQQQINSPLRLLDRPVAPLKTPTLLNGNRTPNSASSSCSTLTSTAFEWPRVTTSANKNNKKTT